MKLRPFIPNSPQRHKAGLTLLELLLATVIGLIIIGTSIALVLSNRRVYDLDRARTELNQNLRSAMDVLGSDIRQTGERLPPTFPAILLINGGGNQPDQLTLRRSLFEPLTVCQDVSQNSTSGVVVAVQGSTVSGCSKLGTGVHEPLARWEAYRLANGIGANKTIDAYIFYPDDKTGEFFSFVGISGQTTLNRGAGSWSHTYPAWSPAKQVSPQIYILEERAYRLNGNILQLSQNGGAWQGVASNISNLQISADIKINSTVNTLEALGTSDDWVDLQGLTVRLTGQTVGSRVNLNRTLEAQFLPRNARWQ